MSSLTPRLLPDFISQLWRKLGGENPIGENSGFLHRVFSTAARQNLGVRLGCEGGCEVVDVWYVRCGGIGGGRVEHGLQYTFFPL